MTEADISETATLWDGTTEAFAGGDGATPETAYQISNGKQLKMLADSVNAGETYEGKYFVLTDDILLNAGELSSWATAESVNTWVPIGTEDVPFMGIFDGAGHTIYGVVHMPDTTTQAYIGLFGVTDTATVRDLSLVAYVADTGSQTESSTSGAGALIGYAKGTTVEDCDAHVVMNVVYSVTTGNVAVGGIIGLTANNAEGKPCSVSHCRTDGSVYGKNNKNGGRANASVGGILGLAKGTSTAHMDISHCVNDAQTDAEVRNGSAFSKAGGIAGATQYATVYACENFAAVTATTGGARAGGIVGEVANETDVTSCYNFGDITSDKDGGGIVGWHLNYGLVPFGISYCGNEGNITGLSRSGCVGGVIGSIDANSGSGRATLLIRNNYNTGFLSSDGKVGGVLGGFENANTDIHIFNNVNHGDAVVHFDNTANVCIGGIAGNATGYKQSVYNNVNAGALTIDETVASDGTYVIYAGLVIGNHVGNGNVSGNYTVTSAGIEAHGGGNYNGTNYTVTAEQLDGTDTLTAVKGEQNLMDALNGYGDVLEEQTALWVQGTETPVVPQPAWEGRDDIYGASLTLGSAVSLNFYLPYQRRAEGLTVTMTVACGEENIALTSPTTAVVDGHTYDVYTLSHIAAADFGDTMTISFSYGESDAVVSQCTTEYSVTDYAANVYMNASTSAEMKSLVESIVYYGDLAAKNNAFSDAFIEKVAEKGGSFQYDKTAYLDTFGVDMLISADYTENDCYQKIAALLTDSVSLVVVVDHADAVQAKVTVNGADTVYDIAQGETTGEFVIECLNAAQMNRAFEITLLDDAGNAIPGTAVTYAIANYLASVIDGGGTDAELAKAVALYMTAARAYAMK